MLNFCYVYSVIWFVILCLYCLGWSALCAPLDRGLLIFLVCSILVSLLLGYSYKSCFKFRKIDKYPNRRIGVTVFIWLAFCIDYLYCRQIPLLSIILKSSSYTSFKGIPTIHTLLSTFASFYAQYLFYLAMCFPEKRKTLLYEYISILFVSFFLQFNRGQILINLFISLCIFTGANKRFLKPKYSIPLLVAVVVALFLFGCLGNIRHGFSWNDCSYIEYLGKYNKYPTWLPKQFMWSYSYITSPLANLNYNVQTSYSKASVIGTITTFFPDFIIKRVFPSYFSTEPIQLVSYFTATAAFGKAYLFGDYIGIVLLFIFYTVIQLAIIQIVRIKTQYKIPLIGIMCAIVAFSFFTHTLSYSAISFVAVYPILTIIRLPKFKIKVF